MDVLNESQPSVVTATFSIVSSSFVERIGRNNLCRLKIILSYVITSIEKVRDLINAMLIYDIHI